MKTTFIILLCVSSLFVNAQNNAGEQYTVLAESFRKSAKSDSAIFYFELAAKEFKKSNNTEGLANSYNQAAVLLTRQDKYEKAKAYLFNALTMGLSLTDTNNLLVATTYISLGVVFGAEENYSQSLLYHNKALAIRLLKLGENHSDVATSYGNIGNIYHRSKDYDRAIEAHLKALQVREKLFGKTGTELIQSYTNLGNAYREKKAYSTSLEYFNKALQTRIANAQPAKEMSPSYKKIYEVYYLIGDTANGDLYKAKAGE